MDHSLALDQWHTWPVSPTRYSSSRFLAATVICLGLLAIAVLSSAECLHWFIVPAFACGVLCCYDGLLLFRHGGRNLFEPVPLVGAFGVYFFFIAPVVHVANDYWFTSEPWGPKEIPDDWRPWLGFMAALNLAGLLLYRVLYPYCMRLFLRRTRPSFRTIDVRGLKFYGPAFIAAASVLQLYVYYHFGWIAGFVQAFGNASQKGTGGFAGFGWVFTLAESVPLLLAIVCSVLFRRHLQNSGVLRLGVYLGIMLVLAVLFGGLRGSRGNTIYTIAYVCGIIHLTVRPISRKLLGMWALVLLLFMYIYGFFKSNPELFADPALLVGTIVSPDTRANLERTTHRSAEAVLMGDLDRSDLQAYLLFRMVRQGADTELGYGRTYVEGALCFIPEAIFHYRPPGKTKYGTDIVHGAGTYSPMRYYTKIYGVAGETMLNFGPYSAPLGFIWLAICVGCTRAISSRMASPLDVRRYIVPICSISCIVCVSCDIDNVLFVLLQHALVPLALVKVCSIRRSPARGGWNAHAGTLGKVCPVSGV